MKSKLIIALAAAASVATGQLFAQTRALPLTEAIELSIKNSGQLKVANAKVDEAIAMRKEAWNNHLPDIKVTGAYMRLGSPDVNLKMKTGGTDTSSSKSGMSSLNVHEAAYGMANATLPLFSGLRIKYGVESAKYLEQAAKLDAEKDKEDVIENTIGAYCNLYKAKRSVDLITANLNQAQKRVADFSNLEKNGLLARNDLLKAQLQQSNIELSLLDAQNNLGMANINMNLMLGLPRDTQLSPDSMAFITPAEAGTIAEWEQSALMNRKEIASITTREKAANAAIKSTKGEYYPGIALTGGYIAADIPNVLTLTNVINVGLGLQYNIGSLWKTGAKVAQSKARLYQLQANEGMVADMVRLQINKSYQDYLLSQKKIDVYARSVEQANENYRITRNKYDNNLVTTTDLLEADVAQLQAQLNYIFSKIDAFAAYKKLQQTAGTLSEK